MTTFAEAYAFCSLKANEDQIDQLFKALNRRNRTLRDIRADGVSVDMEVTITDITPKALIGLNGTVETINGKRANIRLDAASTLTLRFSNTKHAASVAPDIKQHLLIGVPLSTLVPAER